MTTTAWQDPEVPLSFIYMSSQAKVKEDIFLFSFPTLDLFPGVKNLLHNIPQARSVLLDLHKIWI
jgi:hypothetical protein